MLSRRMTDPKQTLRHDALAFHSEGRPGKLEVTATKPLNTQQDLFPGLFPRCGASVP